MNIIMNNSEFTAGDKYSSWDIQVLRLYCLGLAEQKLKTLDFSFWNEKCYIKTFVDS